MASPSQEDYTTTLISAPPRRPSPRRTPSLLLLTFISFFSSLAFAFFFLSSSSTTQSLARRSLSVLRRPTVILISSDGFRYGYQFKCPTPNIHRLISNGTEAVPGLVPVFPTLTFPNHYSIVTGLYPESHGIINNFFIDPISGDAFSKRRHEPRWWLGEPLWETVSNQGFKAAAYFWAGSEVSKGSWDCPPEFCPKYDSSVPFEKRVDDVLSYFDLPIDEIPLFVALYFEEPDSKGHEFGPDHPEITKAVARIDTMIGRLIASLESRGIFEDVSIILVGHHGMVGTCDQRLIFLDDLSPWIKIPQNWVHCYSPLLAIQPPANIYVAAVVAALNQGLSSGKVENGQHLIVYLKEDLPERLHYSSSYRIPPVIGLVDEGYKVVQKRPMSNVCGGDHGYDNALLSMRSIFVAHGPQFERGRKVQPFENVQIYNLITSILGLKGVPNNGSSTFPDYILLSDN
ncbi:hypothetical protein J5N97_015962 [Dioscorea zingiberensis]|uniref:Uncharacterized protein n=1 Tax=Dioscorea zingiberensis TaxID=325984 RepID=A0A9D5HF76_9LILI|nr:hypothetical protein J5N97_015962 [Dioscorea zingiberensis]